MLILQLQSIQDNQCDKKYLLDSKFCRLSKLDSIKGKLTEDKDLFFSDITDLMQRLEEMVKKFESIDEIELEVGQGPLDSTSCLNVRICKIRQRNT